MEMIREGIRETQELRRSIKEQGAEFDRRKQETDRQIQETHRIAQKTSKDIGNLGNSIGRVIEHMVAGNNIIKKFKALDYVIESHSRNKQFGHTLPPDMQGEIDMFLENGDIAILIEVKMTLDAKDVNRHKQTLERFRRFSDTKGDKRRFIGAVAGAVVEGDAEKVAHENGMYVIAQSGKSVEILPTPEGFQAKEW